MFETTRLVNSPLHPRSIYIGDDHNTGKPVRIRLADLSATSMHLVGGAGYGKSFQLRQIIRELIRGRQSVGVIDPHAELVDFALYEARRSGIPASRVVLLDPSVTDFSLAFNPFYSGVSDVGIASSMVLDAFMRSWDTTMDQTPRLEGLLRATLHMLIASRLTLAEAHEILNPDNVALRRVLRDRIADENVRGDWLEFEKWSRPDKLAMVESTRNRIKRLMHADSVVRMLAQTERTLNVRDAMDQGRLIFVSLGGLPRETQRLLGTLLINACYQAAMQRDSRRRRPYFLICDEFAEVLTPVVASALAQTRKRGLHWILAHQTLRQLEVDSPEILSSVLGNAKIRIAMGGLSRPDAEIIARELFTGEVHGQEVKHVTMATKFRPVTDTFTVETESESLGSGDGVAESSGYATTIGSGESSGRSWLEDPATGPRAFDDPYQASLGHTASSSASTSDSRGRSRTTSRGTSTSRSTVPITRHEQFIEESGRQFVDVSEQWERRVGIVANQGKRDALLRVYNGGVIRMRTPDIEPERMDRRQEAYKQAVLQNCPEVLPAATVKAKMEQRRRDLKALAEKAEADGRPFDVRSFRG